MNLKTIQQPIEKELAEFEIYFKKAMKSQVSLLDKITYYLVKRKGKQATFRAPEKEGAYRLFIFVYDGKKHYAYANQPFYVMPRDPEMGQGKFVTFKKLSGI